MLQPNNNLTINFPQLFFLSNHQHSSDKVMHRIFMTFKYVYMALHPQFFKLILCFFFSVSLTVFCTIISSPFVSFSLQHWYFCNKQLIFSFLQGNPCINTTQAHTPVHTHILTHFSCLSKSPPFILLLLIISVVHAHICKENAYPHLCSLFFLIKRKL